MVAINALRLPHCVEGPHVLSHGGIGGLVDIGHVAASVAIPLDPLLEFGREELAAHVVRGIPPRGRGVISPADDGELEVGVSSEGDGDVERDVGRRGLFLGAGHDV